MCEKGAVSGVSPRRYTIMQRVRSRFRASGHLHARGGVPAALPLLLLLLLWATAACAPAERPLAAASPGVPTASPASVAAASPTSAALTRTPVLSPPVPPVTVPAAAQAAVDAALREAGTRLGLPPTQLRLESVEPQDWSDSALGCPQPGVLYAQVITPGYRVITAAGSTRLEYHTDATGRRVTFCRQL